MASNKERYEHSQPETQSRQPQEEVVISDEVGDLEGKVADLLRWRRDGPASESTRSERDHEVRAFLELGDLELRERIADACQLDLEASRRADWRTLAAVLLSQALSTQRAKSRKAVPTSVPAKSSRARGRPPTFGDSWAQEILALVDSVKWEDVRMFRPKAMSDAEAAERVAVLKLRTDGKRTIGREKESLTRRIRDDLPYARRLRFHKLVSDILSRTEPVTAEQLRPYNWFSTDEELQALAEQRNAATPELRMELAQMLANVEREMTGKSAPYLKRGK